MIWRILFVALPTFLMGFFIAEAIYENKNTYEDEIKIHAWFFQGMHYMIVENDKGIDIINYTKDSIDCITFQDDYDTIPELFPQHSKIPINKKKKFKKFHPMIIDDEDTLSLEKIFTIFEFNSDSTYHRLPVSTLYNTTSTWQ